MEKWFIFGRDAAFDEGLRHVELGNCAEAAAAFEVCLGRPCEPAIKRLATQYLCQSLMRMAEASLGSEDALEAVSLLTRAVHFHPDYADLQLRLAIAYARSGDSESAIASCREALRINPLYAQAHQVLEAVAMGKAVDAPIADNVQTRITAAKHAQRERNLELSEAILNELVLAHLNYADVRCLYSQVLMELDRMDECITHLQAALKINPRFSDAWATLGVAWKRIGLRGEAELAFSTALEINPNHPVATAELPRVNQ